MADGSGSVLSAAEREKLLSDDVPHGDLTTLVLGIGAAAGVMTFAARSAMVVALVEDAADLLRLAGAKVTLSCRSADRLEAGAAILRAEGAAAALHRGWKVAQTLVEIASGYASEARAIVDAARAVVPEIAVVCSRKNLPGSKTIAVAAIRAGGAQPHRLGLSETILLFSEHRAFLDEPLPDTVARLRRGAPEKTLVIEVAGVDEGIAAARAGFDIIQAEKFAPHDIAHLCEALRREQLASRVAAAGGITPANAAAYAGAGAHILVTSAPYAAKPRDVAVRIMRAP